MNNPAEMLPPDGFGDGPLEEGGKDQIRPEKAHGLRRNLVIDIELHRHLMPEFLEFNKQSLAQAVEAVGQ